MTPILTMNILVVGSGGREHALAWKLSQSPKVNQIFVAPGNAGTACEDASRIKNVPIKEHDIPALVEFAKENSVGLTVVGPEIPLCAGIVDVFESANLRIFGPCKAAAQLEGSKIFCKEILHKASVPTANFHVFSRGNDAVDFLKGRDSPIVVKADGLAAGKGVFVCEHREEAVDAVQRITRDRVFGSAGDKIILEDRLTGQEASVLAITDGKTIVTLQPAQDHKAAYDGDTGPNTGGMGAYSPTHIVDDATLHWIEEHILVPTVHALNTNGTPFKGVLYAGLMMTKQGPKVLEYNVRFGDPECQPLLMRLQTDLVDLFEATIDGTLEHIDPLVWDTRHAVCVVMASEGYPGEYKKGFVVSGLEEAAGVPNTKVFHSGTSLDESGAVINSGGRVFGVTGLGDSVADAKLSAYKAVKPIRWEGAWCRKDIADKALAEG